MANIYLMKIEEAAKLPKAYAEAHFPERLAKAKKFAFEQDYFRSMGAGYLLFEILGLEDKDIFFNASGKPLSRKTKEYFSISHSGEYILLATDDKIIGSDIEMIKGYNSSVSKRVFTDEEQRFISENPDRFYLLWSLKESAAKAIGEGINYPFDSFSALPMLENKAICLNETMLYGAATVFGNYSIAVCSANHCKEALQEIIEIRLKGKYEEV